MNKKSMGSSTNTASMEYVIPNRLVSQVKHYMDRLRAAKSIIQYSIDSYAKGISTRHLSFSFRVKKKESWTPDESKNFSTIDKTLRHSYRAFQVSEAETVYVLNPSLIGLWDPSQFSG